MQTAKEPEKQSKKREDAENRLIVATIELLSEKGHDGFSLADVGERAGYSRSLPAHHFGTRRALVRRVIVSIAMPMKTVRRKSRFERPPVTSAA